MRRVTQNRVCVCFNRRVNVSFYTSGPKSITLKCVNVFALDDKMTKQVAFILMYEQKNYFEFEINQYI